MAEPVRIDNAPAQVALFRYDNNTFIMQNFLPAEAEIMVSVAGTVTQIHDLVTGKTLSPAPEPERGFGRSGFGERGLAASPQRTSFNFTVPPHSYLSFGVN